jgi:TonB family protein
MSSAEVWKTWEGRVIDGKFPLRQWLSGSDHSAVFLTERPGQLSQKFALKLSPADAGDADRQLARWRAAAQLSHPHLMRLYETGRSGQTLLYAVMEYAEEDLSQILPQRPLAPAEVTDLLPPLLDALSYLHGKGFVHGRIAPSNILAVGDQLKLSTDQVMSAGEGNSSRRRRDIYDAPETAAGIVSPEGDLWSVGVTLVAALTQNVSFADEKSQGDPSLPATIAEPFRGIVRECLHLDPKRRCSIAEIKARLQPAARSVPAAFEEPITPSRPGKRRPIAAALIVAALLVTAIVFYSRGKSVPATTSAPVTTEQPAAQSTPAPAPAPPATAPPANQAASSQPTEPPKKAASSQGGVAHQVIPEVSQSARNTIRGTIKVGVRVEVNPSGKVTTAKFKSAGPSRYFAGLAMKAAERWEFSPPVVDGQPAPSAWLLEFRFKRGSTQASSARISR